MKIKNITDFTIEECRTYLEQNPNGPLTKDVQSRLNFLLDEIVTLEEKERQAKIAKQDELSKIEWIDVNQFLEKKHYKRHTFFRGFWFVIMFIAAFLICCTIYYTNTEHYMFTGGWKQEEYVSGIEYFLLRFDFIDTSVYWEDRDFPGFYPYYSYDSLYISILIFIIAICTLLIYNIFHSSALSNIYNIENTDYKKNKFVIVQNRSGEMGICRCDKHRLVSLLSMNFTKIYHCGEDAYIVMMDEKFGVFNATLRKMVIPVIYDNIEIEGKDCLLAIKNNVGSRFTTKGYRIVS